MAGNGLALTRSSGGGRRDGRFASGHRRPARSLWWAILIVAVVTGVFGMLLLIDPAGGARLTVIFTGIAFLLEGILKLCVVIYTVKLRNDGNVVYEEKFTEVGH